MWLHSDTSFLIQSQIFPSYSKHCVIKRGLESTIYHTRGEHINHYTTDAVFRMEWIWNILDNKLQVYWNLNQKWILFSTLTSKINTE
jgi:hypothetical protein